jgi:hypothetical protein
VVRDVATGEPESIVNATLLGVDIFGLHAGRPRRARPRA